MREPGVRVYPEITLQGALSSQVIVSPFSLATTPQLRRQQVSKLLKTQADICQGQREYDTDTEGPDEGTNTEVL